MTTYGTRTIPIGALVFDALGDPAPVARMIADGWAARTVYIAPSSGNPGKITDANRAGARDRLTGYLNGGLGVILNYEASGQEWTRGRAPGFDAGRWAAELAAEVGYPSTVAVLTSLDSNVTTATLPAALAYADGFHEGLDGAQPLGVYAERSVIFGLGELCVLGWATEATAWDHDNPAPLAHVHLQQRRPTTAEIRRMPYTRPTPTTWSLDANDVLDSFAAWSLVDDPTPPPPPPPPPPIVVPPAQKVATVNLDLPYLTEGMPNNNAVGTCQLLLNVLSGAGLKIDNNYGPVTAGKVEAYQRFCQLTVDREVGAQTWGSLLTAATGRNWAS